MHEQYFEQIALSTDPTVVWSTRDIKTLQWTARKRQYETSLRHRISLATTVSTDLSELAAVNGSSAGDLVLWYTQTPRDTMSTLFKDMAAFFGLWHEMRRGSFQGVHEFCCRGRNIFLVDTLVGPRGQPSPFMDIAPSGKRQIFERSPTWRKAVGRFAGRSKTNVCRETATLPE